jgi:hypothetical protein
MLLSGPPKYLTIRHIFQKSTKRSKHLLQFVLILTYNLSFMEIPESDFLFYSGKDGKANIAIIADRDRETIWTSQKNIGQIFNVDVRTVSEHIQNIFNSNELERDSTVRKIRIVQTEGTRNVERQVDFYNLDVIIAIGYRVNSYEATQFRMWSTKTLKNYLIKGFVMDDERFKQGKELFGKDYFSELLERIKEIRASERMFYQKVTDLYAESIDYDVNSPITQKFYATVQNKLHWAIHQHTAAELIQLRAKADLPNMGLTTWKNAAKGGKIIKTDIGVAKNYLTQEETEALNRLVSMYLDYAENLVQRGVALKMAGWASKLDAFLQFNEYELINDTGKVKHEIAAKIAEKEYAKFRVKQDQEFRSDFDKTVEQVRKLKKKDPSLA